LFDDTVAQAVRQFQRQHGLGVDGVLGFETVAALNVSAETRAQQIAVNMERWRIFPQDLGPRHIDVNIPDFTLEVVEEGRPVIQMKVVVGKMMEEKNTPTFSAAMNSLVLNPYWYVPESIAQKELFPMSRKDPGYFANHGFVIRRVAVGEKQNSDLNAADGTKTAAKTYRYLLRQEPGPKNSLGRVKFMFPNAYGVYLHDTPAKELFNRRIRTFSHGCIRVEKPIDLAEYILRGTPEWTRETILATIEQQKMRTIQLAEPVPVYIQYWTAWVDREGMMQFRNDIYGYDGLPDARLPTTPPKPKLEVQAAGRPELPSVTRAASQPALPSEAQPSR
jgi:murein L,D-transpeptidase YcbB/YkuD